MKYLKNENLEGEKEELFEKLVYDKVLELFTLFDLLFMVNEKYDELDIYSHLEKYKKYCERKKDLKVLLKGFPSDQILSPLVKEIYNELTKDKSSNDYSNLMNKTISFKNEDDISETNYYELQINENNLITSEICLSIYKPPYIIKIKK